MHIHVYTDKQTNEQAQINTLPQLVDGRTHEVPVL